jgi:hypothetical protein
MIFAEEIVNYESHKNALKDRDNHPYINSKFLVYKEMSSKKKGKYFEIIVEEYLEKNGYKVSKAKNTDHDRIINNLIKLEIKSSLLWGTGTHFRWQQIRTSQDYDLMCFLAVYPDRIQFYGATKDVIKSNLEVQDENGKWTYNQHGGKRINSGTFVIDGMPEDFSWFQPLEELL